MVFRAFLEERRERPRRLRAHLGSGLAHAAVLLLLAWLARSELLPPVPALALPVVPVSLMRPGPAAAGAEAAGGPAPAAATPPRARRAAPRPRPVEPVAVPEPAAVVLAGAPVATDEGGGAEVGGSGASVGLGDGLLSPDGAGGGGSDSGGRRRRPELFARVIGSGIRPGTVLPADRTFVSLKEATALRTHDFFPRLPAALWTERGPYLVSLEICVSEEGRVTDAALRSNASARLDPLVVAAARGWRYRPRVDGGRAVPFCHGVLIRYDLTY